MKRFVTLHLIENEWILSYEEDGIVKQYSSNLLNDIKSKCNDFGFRLDFTGVLNGN